MVIKEPILSVLRAPGSLGSLRFDGQLLLGEDGTFPIEDGIVCLLKPEDRQADLGDLRFYDQHPFGERDWKNESDIRMGVEPELQALLTQLSKDTMIVDVGSGPGRISNYLSVDGFEHVVSVDYSRASLMQVRRNSNNTCIWGNNLCLPFADSSFNLVISSGVIHHTPDPYRALSECVRILRPGGFLYLRVYNLISLYGLLYYSYGSIMRALESSPRMKGLADLIGFDLYKTIRRLVFRLPSREDRILRSKFANLFTKRMVHFFTARSLNSRLRQHGLNVLNYRKRGMTHRMLCYVCRKQF